MTQESISRFFTAKSEGLVQELLEHPRTQRITQDPESFAFIVRSEQGYEAPQKMSGLFTQLKRRLYPARVTAGQIKRKKGTSGRANGTLVHRQIHHLITCEKEGNTCDCTIKTNKRRLNKYTVALFDKLKSLEIEPLATEVPILCKRGGFCTRLDMVGARNGIPVIISLKTGYSVGYNRDSRGTVFERPFQSIKATSQNINQLQACSEHQILKREYGLAFPEYKILYMGKSDKELVSVEEPAKWWWNTDSETLDAFYQQLTQNGSP